MPLAAPPALSHSIQRTVGPLPHDLKGRAVTFPSASGATLHGWLLEGSPGNGAILLMHGVRASRLDMLERARFLVAAGYSVMQADHAATHQVAADYHGDLEEHGGSMAVYDSSSEATHDTLQSCCDYSSASRYDTASSYSSYDSSSTSSYDSASSYSE